MIPSMFSAARFARPAAATCASARYASLSAIHRGLRRSERVQYGSTRPRDDDRRSSNTFEPRGRSSSTRLTDRALGGAASDRQRQKLRKKLSRKEAEQEDEEDGRQTRRKRFTNPEFEFGKTSLVYEMKHGALKDKLDQFQQERRDELRAYQVDRRSTRESGARDRQPDRDFRERSSERQWRSRDDREPRRARDDRGRDDPSRPEERPSNDISSKMRSARRDTTAPTTTIRYTTAASQFLYGRSVVHSALSQSRRKLYKLYVQTGANRSADDTLESLAASKGVRVQRVPSSEQHVMDKISMGRPHNGYILETSPLPQLPATSLGALEETPSKLGFHVEIAHQTREELDVNGTDTFFKRSGRTAKPLVLLLHEIGDPGNLGGMLRTASYLGVDAVAITSRSSSGLTPVVLKSAAGAVEEIPILRVDSPVEFLNKSREHGWKTYAAVAPPDRTLARRHGDKFVSLEDVEAARPLDESPCILVMGNEGHGLPKAVKVAADYELSVPRFVHESCVDSLNVSVAAGVLAHAFVRGAAPQPKPKPAAMEDGVPEEPKETFF